MDYFSEAVKYSSLLYSLQQSCRNVRWKDSVIAYEHNAAINTYKLRQDILSGKYKISQYQVFTIHEPKEREITATRLRDRQVQRALCNAGLYKDLTEHFIYDNCACQVDKGVDFALKRFKTHLSRYYRENGINGYVLKCDIHHFFAETDHEIAKQAVAKRISDRKAAEYVNSVIDSFGGDKGIGLGSQISQLVELCILDGLDHFIKEKLKIKHYIRYMDDFILIHKDKQYLVYCLRQISAELQKLKLSLNSKTNITPLKNGVIFLKWRFEIKPKTGKIYMLMSKTKPKRERRKIKKLLNKEFTGEFIAGTALTSLICWIANAKKGNCGAIVYRITKFYNNEVKRHEHN